MCLGNGCAYDVVLNAEVNLFFRFVPRKSERKFLLLQRKLEHIQERELSAQETLSQVLTVVGVLH